MEHKLLRNSNIPLQCQPPIRGGRSKYSNNNTNSSKRGIPRKPLFRHLLNRIRRNKEVIHTNNSSSSSSSNNILVVIPRRPILFPRNNSKTTTSSNEQTNEKPL
mmetsp:Transcript_15090/g.31236  ORF Transcript_15090/g.31236 Transcript_15090/m.31236 type:complete len:104 (-) Transcript_15090:1101-1412(-)